MVAIASLLEVLDLEPAVAGQTDRFRGANLPAEHGVVFGGQLMAQTLVAAQQGRPDMTVKTLHTVFARAAAPDQPLDVVVETGHAGRTFASTSVRISQGERLCTTSMVLLNSADHDLIRHATPQPAVAGPESAPAGGQGDWEIRVVDGVDLSDPEAVGPAQLDVWTRFAGAPDDPVISQALLAFASDGFLIGTAMRPHAGVGQAQAHKTLSTGVISHTLTFHEPFSASAWMLLDHESPYAGRGRSFGRAHVFDQTGQLVASFSQDAMIRPRPEGAGSL